jgi:hypothetical protein
MSEVPKGFSKHLATQLLFWEQQNRADPPRLCSSGNGIVLQKVRDKIVCNDGFSFSCQASGDHYCSPKEYGLPANAYKSWEIGYPSKPDHAILPYIEDEDRDATGSVYPYVPTDVVIDLIVKHGGLKCQ